MRNVWETFIYLYDINFKGVSIMNIFHLEKLHKAAIYGSSLTIVASSILFSSPVLADDGLQVEELIVTAQKRPENLQDVPISITTLTEQALNDLNIKDFADYVMQLPSVSAIQRRPGMGQIFIRGISDSGNSNQSLQGPAAAIYLDESPVTMVGDNLDIHIYDIERIEALSGPQGTLYGAASQAGNLRIITKKPTDEFDSGFNLSFDSTSGGGLSNMVESFINIPLSENAAIRIVGYNDRDAGYIDSVSDSITFPLSGITKGNDDYVENDFNDSVKSGYRAALRINLDDNWVLDGSIMGQNLESDGVWDHDPDRLGAYKVGRFFEDSQEDDWTRFSATITGDLGFADLTFTTSSLDRDFEVLSDYSHYSIGGYVEGYYTCYTPDTNPCVDPSVQFENDTSQTFDTHEIRLSSNSDNRLSWILGAFYTENETKYNSQWHVPTIPSDRKVPTSEDLYYQTDQVRKDSEDAIFGELYYQLNDKTNITIGHRRFDNETKLNGFVGTVVWPSNLIGSSTRPDNVNSLFKGKDSISKLNIAYDVSDDTMIYLTKSEGYRPGGANRAEQLGSTYDADFLKNTEFGFKSIFSNGKARLNGALYQMNWDDIQLGWFEPSISLLGLVDNIGKAESSGYELDLRYLLTANLSFNIAASKNDAKLKADYVLRGSVRAINGQDLPLTPDLKYNFNVNYESNKGNIMQFNYVYVDSMWNSLFYDNREKQDSYAIANFFYIKPINDNSSIQIYIDNIFDEKAELYINYGDDLRLITVNRPRVIGIKYSWNFN